MSQRHIGILFRWVGATAMTEISAERRFNLTKARVLVVDGSAYSLELTSQMLKAFGVTALRACQSVEDAKKALATGVFDLLVIDPATDEAGYDLIRAARQAETANRFVPIILVCGHVRASQVGRARDCGANFVVTKPLSPQVLLKRILWAANDKRSFVELDSYCGPDRRFKYEGPPVGTDGRRSTDLNTPLCDAESPNLSQTDINEIIKPQRVTLAL